MPIIVSVALAAAVAAVPALPVESPQVKLNASRGGHTYFNRPGADLAAHNAEMKACMKQADLTVQPDNGQGGLVAAIMQAMVDGQGNHANVENCMVVRGWRVMKLSDARGDYIAKLDAGGKAHELSAMVGAAEPPGDIVRVWNNDAADNDTNRTGGAHFFGGKSLSFGVVQPDPYVAPAAVKLPRQPKTAKPPKALKPEKIAGVPDGFALLVVNAKGGSLNGATLVLRRESADPAAPAWVKDGLPDTVLVAANRKPEGATQVFVVPAGKWRIQSMSGYLITVNFCLGAPEFDVKAGEVAYAGSFDFKAHDLGPDLSLDAPRGYLAAHPDLAGPIRPVSYANGSTATCGDNYIYALEVRGAPFISGYGWGGAKPSISASGAVASR